MPDPLTPERLAELAATYGPMVIPDCPVCGSTCEQVVLHRDWNRDDKAEPYWSCGRAGDGEHFTKGLIPWTRPDPRVVAAVDEVARLRERVAELERERDILVAWEAAELSEGQASRLLGVDRMTARGMKLDTIARAGRWRE